MNASDNVQNSQQFIKILNQELQLAEGLLEAMQNEQRQLETTDLEPLKEINDAKMLLLDRLEEASKLRARFLLGVARGQTQTERLEAFLKQQDQATANHLNELIDRLDALLAECKQQNQINGKIIAMSQRRVMRNLNLLKGVDSNSMTYDTKGQAQASGQSLRGVKV